MFVTTRSYDYFVSRSKVNSHSNALALKRRLSKLVPLVEGKLYESAASEVRAVASAASTVVVLL